MINFNRKTTEKVAEEKAFKERRAKAPRSSCIASATESLARAAASRYPRSRCITL